MELPADIDRIATDILRAGSDEWGMYLAIGRAIVAERERCARICDEWPSYEGTRLAKVIRTSISVRRTDITAPTDTNSEQNDA